MFITLFITVNGILKGSEMMEPSKTHNLRAPELTEEENVLV